MQSKVVIRGLRLYAYHGVLPQEQKVGAYFTIDLDVETDISAAIQSDDLNDTLSYSALSNLVKREMDIPSKLVEHVAGRITQSILAEHPRAMAVHIRLLKENPPMNVHIQSAGVELNTQRQKENK